MNKTLAMCLAAMLFGMAASRLTPALAKAAPCPAPEQALWETLTLESVDAANEEEEALWDGDAHLGHNGTAGAWRADLHGPSSVWWVSP
jgi:hypothetical protein